MLIIKEMHNEKNFTTLPAQNHISDAKMPNRIDIYLPFYISKNPKK